MSSFISRYSWEGKLAQTNIIPQNWSLLGIGLQTVRLSIQYLTKDREGDITELLRMKLLLLVAWLVGATSQAATREDSKPHWLLVQTEDNDVTENGDVTNQKAAISDEDANGDTAWEDYVEMLYNLNLIIFKKCLKEAIYGFSLTRPFVSGQS